MQPTKTSASDTTATLPVVTETTLDSVKATMQKQLDGWSKRIANMKSNAEKAKEEAKTALREQVAALEAFEVTAKEHLVKMDAIAADGWHKVKAEIEETWGKLGKSIEAGWAKVTGHEPAKQ